MSLASVTFLLPVKDKKDDILPIFHRMSHYSWQLRCFWHLFIYFLYLVLAYATLVWMSSSLFVVTYFRDCKLREPMPCAPFGGGFDRKLWHGFISIDPSSLHRGAFHPIRTVLIFLRVLVFLLTCLASFFFFSLPLPLPPPLLFRFFSSFISLRSIPFPPPSSLSRPSFSCVCLCYFFVCRRRCVDV